MESILSHFRKIRHHCRFHLALVIVHLVGAKAANAETFGPLWSESTQKFNFRQEIAKSALDPAGNIVVAGHVVENEYKVSGVYVAKRQQADGELIWGITRQFEPTNYAYP